MVLSLFKPSSGAATGTDTTPTTTGAAGTSEGGGGRSEERGRGCETEEKGRGRETEEKEGTERESGGTAIGRQPPSGAEGFTKPKHPLAKLVHNSVFIILAFKIYLHCIPPLQSTFHAECIERCDGQLWWRGEG